MNIKKSPERMCISCRKRAGKDDFVRIVRSKDGELSVDITAKKDGRGAYICANEKCIALAEKKNCLARAFKTKVDANIYEQLRKNIR